MADIPSFADLFAAGRREALVRPTRITRQAIDTEGTDANVLIASSAAMAEEVAIFFQEELAGLFFGTAKDRKLDRLNHDRYQLIRNAATPAVVNVRLDRQGSVGFTMFAGDTVSTDSGVRFALVNDLPIAPNNLGPYYTMVRAVEAGTSGRVDVGEIRNVDSSYLDTTLTVTNEEVSAGGNDPELDPEFSARGRDFFLAARRGTKLAIEIGARSVPGVDKAIANEVLDANGSPAYRGELFIADSNGQANTALAQLVRIALNEYRGLGVPVSVVPANPLYVEVVVTGLLFVAGANTTQALQDARAAIMAAVNGSQPGETLRRASIISALKSVRQIIVPDNAVTEPTGDLVPDIGRIIRTTLDRITFV